MSGGDHRFFKRITRKKRSVTREENNSNNNNNNNKSLIQEIELMRCYNYDYLITSP
jgi:hypothetical protein